jgi:hypothetical protein
MYSINCFIPIARVIMVASCGSYLIRTLKVFASLGGKVYDASGNFLPTGIEVFYLLLVTACLFFDELCRRFLNFSRSCIKHDCPLIRFIAYYGIVHARSCSPIGLNVLYCLRRYNCTYNNFLFGSINSIIN